MITKIRNGRYKVTVSDKGAELQSFYDLKNDLEYIWNGDKKIWNERSPLLFPVVGMQKDGYYEYGGRQFSMPMHGFAKLCSFSPAGAGRDYISYLLSASEVTLRHYPFNFELLVTYSLKISSLSIQFKIKNLSGKLMPFSLGAHPAFRVPIAGSDPYTDYFLEFEQMETASRFPLRERLLSGPVPYLKAQKTLALTPVLFNDGALIFKDLKSRRIELKSKNSSHGVRVDFKDFSYLGLWAFPNAPYICIEPWNGIASSQTSSHDIFQKEGIQLLPPNESISYEYSITVY